MNSIKQLKIRFDNTPFITDLEKMKMRKHFKQKKLFKIDLILT